MIRADLEGMRDWYAGCIFWCTLAVAAGCAMEFPEVIHEFRPQLFAKKYEKLIQLLSTAGLMLVVLGLAGELCFEHWRAGYEGLLERYNDILLEDAERHTADAQLEAGNAKLSADEAALAATRANNEANSAAFRVDVISREADQIGEGLRKTQSSLAWQGPRFNAINANLSQFDRLKQFPGQSFIASVCWGQYIYRGDQEMTNTSGTLSNALTASGWRRDDLSPSLVMEKNCGTIGEGILVFVRDDAPERTKNAAKMLGAVIDEVMKQVIPVSFLNAKAREYMGLTQMPSDTIDIRVSMHPMQPTGPGIDDLNLLKSDTQNLNPRPRKNHKNP
jgi:hypothetical protein